MKNYILFIAVLLAFSSCEHFESGEHHQISLLIDITDTVGIQTPNIQKIFEQFYRDKSSFDGYHIRIATISDALVSDQFDYYFEKSTIPILSNSGNREKKRDSFIAKVQKRVSKISKERVAKNKSQVFEKIIREVNDISLSESL